MKTHHSHSAEDTYEYAKLFAQQLQPKDVIAFIGGLGAGKTTFVRGLVEGLGIKADVSSPTFALMNEYRGDDITLYHFDMYRITDFESLMSTGFFDFIGLKNSILAIEWSENIKEELPEDTIYIKLEQDTQNPDMRIIKIEGDRF